jgi:hypothetical protein
MYRTKNYVPRPQLLVVGGTLENQPINHPNSNVMVGISNHQVHEPSHHHIGYSMEGGDILDLGHSSPLLSVNKLKQLNFGRKQQGRGIGGKEKKDKIEKIKFEF